MWYVIQVINGREDVMRERIERVVPAGAMQELFYPQFQTEIKVHGEWVSLAQRSSPPHIVADVVRNIWLKCRSFADALEATLSVKERCLFHASNAGRAGNVCRWILSACA